MRRLACWILICLFAAGYLPSRGEVCRCTAEQNCGCVCWKHRAPSDAIHDREGGAARPCCAAKEPRKTGVCGASHDTGGRPVPALPESKTGTHDSGQPMDWLPAEPPRLAAPEPASQAPDAPFAYFSNDSREPPVPPP